MIMVVVRVAPRRHSYEGFAVHHSLPIGKKKRAHDAEGRGFRSRGEPP